MTIRRLDKDHHLVAIIDDTESEDEELIFCEICQRNGELSKLKKESI